MRLFIVIAKRCGAAVSLPPSRRGLHRRRNPRRPIHARIEGVHFPPRPAPAARRAAQRVTQVRDQQALDSGERQRRRALRPLVGMAVALGLPAAAHHVTTAHAL